MKTVGQDNDYVLTFGKHKGTSIQDVPTGYLNWIMRAISSGKFYGELAETLRTVILQLRADDMLQEDKRRRARRRKAVRKSQRGRKDYELYKSTRRRR